MEPFDRLSEGMPIERSCKLGSKIHVVSVRDTECGICMSGERTGRYRMHRQNTENSRKIDIMAY